MQIHPVIQILLVGGQTIFRTGLRKLLARETDLKISGETADPEEAGLLAAKLQPDVALIDLAITATPALDLLRRLSVSHASVRAMILASAADKPRMGEMLRLGVRGVVMKDSAAEVLVKGIRSVMEGMYWAGDHAVADAAAALRAMAEPNDRAPSRKTFGLTRRELEIVSAIVSGFSNRDIAKKMRISEDTVKHHLTHVFDKVGVYNRLELALFAIHHGLTTESGALPDSYKDK